MFVKGFTREEVLEHKDRWVERTPETSLSKKTSNVITQYDMAMEVYDLMKKRYAKTTITTDEMSYEDACVLDGEIYRFAVIQAIAVCHKYLKGFDRNSIQKIIVPAYTKFSHCRESFVNLIVNAFWR